MESDHFYYHYPEHVQDQVTDIASKMEVIHSRLSQRFNWTPNEKTEIVVSDHTDFSNGFAMPFPTNRIVVLLSPPDAIDGLEDFDDYLESLLIHEYTHTLHGDRAAGLPLWLRRIFGRNPFLFPNIYQPVWLVEGLATDVETDFEKGVGRGQSNYFRMLMRMEVESGIKPVRQVNQWISTWPGGRTVYLYGVYFFQFLKETYGEAAIESWLKHYSNNIIPFLLNTNSRKVTGKSIPKLWQEFELWLQTSFADEIARNSAQGGQDHARLTEQGYSMQNLRIDGEGRLYFLSFNGTSHAAIMRYTPANSQLEHLVDVTPGARFDVNKKGRIAIVQAEVHEQYGIYYDLYIYGEDRLKRLTQGQRIKRVAWRSGGGFDDELLVVQQNDAHYQLRIYDLVRSDFADTLWTSSGEIVGAIDWSANGEHVAASIWRQGQGWQLALFSVKQGIWQWLTEGEPVIHAQPQFNDDGQSLWHIADHNGIYNIYRYHLSERRMTQHTQVLGGAFSPVADIDQKKIYYLGYHRNGFDLYETDFQTAFAENTWPTVPQQQALPVSEASAQFESRDYSPWFGLKPRWWMPYSIVSDSRREYGLHTSAWDALQFHNYSLTLGYDSKINKTNGGLSYRYDRWPLALNLSYAQDNDEDSERDVAIAELDWPIRSISDEWRIQVGYVYDEEEYVANRATGEMSTYRDNLLGVAVLYDSTERYPFSISRTDGRHVIVSAETSDAVESDFSGNLYLIDWREFISLGRHTIAWRGLAGWGSDRPRPFRLGGLDEDSRFHHMFGETFDRRRFPLRGYKSGIAELRGRRMLATSLEWRFPITLVERGIMVPPVAIDRLWGSVFYETGDAWFQGRSPEKMAESAGLEIGINTNIFYNMPLGVRIGFAKGFEDFGREEVYLTIGASF